MANVDLNFVMKMLGKFSQDMMKSIGEIREEYQQNAKKSEDADDSSKSETSREDEKNDKH